MSFEEARNSHVISFSKGSISEEEFLILYHEYESVNPLYPYWEIFEPFCLNSSDSSECKSAKENRPFYSCLLSDQAYEWLRGCR